MTTPPAKSPIIVAVFDIETSVPCGGPGMPSWTDYDRIGFACGVITWYRLDRPDPARVWGTPLHTNVYWSPAAMIDDLLRPWSHAICAYNGDQFDIPVLVHQAVPPERGPYLQTSDAALVAHVAKALHAAQQSSWPLVRLDGKVRDWSQPTSLWDRFLALLGPAWDGRWSGLPLDAREKLKAWMRLTNGQSRVYPMGVAGMDTSREALLSALRAKLFDPLAWFRERTGHPHLVRLDWLREGLELPEYLVDGKPVDHALIPGMWNEGRIWEVIGTCRDDVNVLCRVLQAGCHGPRLFTQRVRNDDHPVDLSPFDQQNIPGAKWRYSFDTRSWWDHLTRVATHTRSIH